MNPQPKKKRLKSAKYLEFIRQQKPADKPFSDERSTVHHIKAWKHGGNQGMSMKSDDYRTIPLSIEGHQEQEQIGEDRFFERYNLNPLHIIIDLMTEFIRRCDGKRH